MSLCLPITLIARCPHDITSRGNTLYMMWLEIVQYLSGGWGEAAYIIDLKENIVELYNFSEKMRVNLFVGVHTSLTFLPIVSVFMHI